MAYNQAFGKTGNLMMVHVGNTLGMRGVEPYSDYTYNALISLDPNQMFAGIPSSEEPDTYAGTTGEWEECGSWSRLNLLDSEVPRDAEVVFAMLVWQGIVNATAPQSVIDTNPPILITPDNQTHEVSIRAGLSSTYGELYTRAADVTEIVQALPSRGAGDYKVKRVPTANPPAHGAGWGLFIVYKHPSFSRRNITFYVGVQPNTTEKIAGFETPKTAPVKARLFTMATYGDDWNCKLMLNGKSLQGPNNPEENFYPGLVNDYNGKLSTVGSFADRNMPYKVVSNRRKETSNRRADFDITNVDASYILEPNSNSTVLAIPGPDVIYGGAVGLQIEIEATTTTSTTSTSTTTTSTTTTTSSSSSSTYSTTTTNPCNTVIHSIGVEEIAIGQIYEAESEKIKVVVQAHKEGKISLDDLLKVNCNVQETIESVIRHEVILHGKLREILKNCTNKK